MWAHLSEMPDDVRKVLVDETTRAEQEDADVIAAVASAIRTQRLAMRVPGMCMALAQARPELAKRKVFMAVSLVTGLSEPHVRRLYYGNGRGA